LNSIIACWSADTVAGKLRPRGPAGKSLRQSLCISWPNIALLAPVPIVTAVVAWPEWRTLNRADSEAGPFIGAIALFAMSYLGLGISLFPYVVPHRLTLWQVASNPSTQVFLLPVILMYSG
jgi:cytochrome d ubiquinol oxidase subunit II